MVSGVRFESPENENFTAKTVEVKGFATKPRRVSAGK
jgi:hypothetical protein